MQNTSLPILMYANKRTSEQKKRLEAEKTLNYDLFSTRKYINE